MAARDAGADDLLATAKVHDNVVFDPGSANAPANKRVRRRTTALIEMLQNQASVVKQLAEQTNAQLKRNPWRVALFPLIVIAAAGACAYALGAFDKPDAPSQQSPAVLPLELSTDGAGGRAFIVAHVPDGNASPSPPPFFNRRALSAAAPMHVAGVAVTAVRTFSSRDGSAEPARRSSPLAMMRASDIPVHGSTGAWRLDLGGIPADVAGTSETHFEARATDADNAVLYEGRSPPVTIKSGSEARISLQLLDTNNHRRGSTSGAVGAPQIVAMLADPSVLNFCPNTEDGATCSDSHGVVSALVVGPSQAVRYSWHVRRSNAEADEARALLTLGIANSTQTAVLSDCTDGCSIKLAAPITAVGCENGATECAAQIVLVVLDADAADESTRALSEAGVRVGVRVQGARATVDLAFHTTPEITSLHRIASTATNQTPGCNPEDVVLEAVLDDADIATARLEYEWFPPSDSSCTAMARNAADLKGTAVRTNTSLPFPPVRAFFRLAPKGGDVSTDSACVFNITVTDPSGPLTASANMTYVYHGPAPAGVHSTIAPRFDSARSVAPLAGSGWLPPESADGVTVPFPATCARPGASASPRPRRPGTSRSPSPSGARPSRWSVCP